MEARRMVARTLRRRLRSSLVVVALVAGVAGGIATGLVSGAGRTATAVERFLDESHVLDVMVSDPELTAEKAEQVRRLPGVQATALLSGVTLFPRGADGFLNVVASIDGHWGSDHDVARLVRGRTPEPDSADEIVLGEAVAEHLGVDIGDVVTFDSWSPEQVAAMQTGQDPEDAEPEFLGPTLALRVVGISRHPTDLVSNEPSAFFTALPPGVWDEYQGQIGEFGFRFLTMDLGYDPSRDQVAAIAKAVRPIVGPQAAFEDAGEQSGQPVLATLDFVAAAMVALAGAVAIGGLVLTGLLLTRTMTRAGEDLEALRPLGMTAGEQGRAATVAALPAAAIAAVVAVGVAVVAAAFMPFGLAARAEPDRGLFIDAAVVATGPVLTAVLVVGLAAAAAARRMAPGPTGASSSSMGIVSRLSSSLPVGAICGLDLAFGAGRGGRRTAARGASRTAIAGVALASIAGVGALVLATSVDRLVGTPQLFGWTWDYTTESGAAELLADDPSVESVGLVQAGAITIGGRPVTTRGVASLKGELPLTVIEGRPAQAGEVVLGTRTMDDLGVGIGDTVVAGGPMPSQELRVVGRAVFAGIIDAPEAGWGAAIPLAEFQKLGIEGDSADGAVVALADSADRAAFLQRLEAAGLEVEVAEEPLELDRLREVKGFPWVLTAFLVVVGLMATAHAIFVTSRRRRGDLAVLRAMGLARRGVYEALSVQAATLALVGLVIGIPLGVIAGRILWESIARPLGVIVSVSVPWAAIMAAGATACLVLAALALVPAQRLARTKPAIALRAE